MERKYPATVNGKKTRAYAAWTGLKYRGEHRGAFSPDNQRNTSYKNVFVCDEWANDYDAFYEWAKEQENFEVWSTLSYSAVDKNIKDRRNLEYCPEKCLLVPQKVNNLLVNDLGGIRTTNKDMLLPPGVTYDTSCRKKACFMGKPRGMAFPYGEFHWRNTPEEAYEDYREFKSRYVSEVALEEYNKGTISKECFDILKEYALPTLEDLLKQNCLKTEAEEERDR